MPRGELLVGADEVLCVRHERCSDSATVRIKKCKKRCLCGFYLDYSRSPCCKVVLEKNGCLFKWWNLVKTSSFINPEYEFVKDGRDKQTAYINVLCNVY